MDGGPCSCPISSPRRTATPSSHHVPAFWKRQLLGAFKLIESAAQSPEGAPPLCPFRPPADRSVSQRMSLAMEAEGGSLDGGKVEA